MPSSDTPPFHPLAAGERWAWRALLFGLAVVTIAVFAYPLSHLSVPMSFNYSEGWNVYWQQAALAGKPLYPARPDASIANYPPIGFHMVAALARITGWEVWRAGRVLGVVCLLWSAVNVATAARLVSRSWISAALAGLFFLLWVALLTVGRVGTDDPNFLALALATLGVCAVLQAEGRAGPIAAAAVFFATALFVKNSVIALAVASALYLLATRRWRLFGIFLLVGAATSAVWLALAYAVDGPFFLAHLLGPRSINRAFGFDTAMSFLGRFDAPLLLTLAGLALGLGRHGTYIGVCLLCTIAAAVVFAFGNGVANNIFYEVIAALAIAAACAVVALRRSLAGVAGAATVALTAALLATASVLVWAPGEVYGALGRTGRLPARAAEYAAAVALIRDTPGPAMCESLMMCAEAGKPLVFDPYYVKDQIATGRFSEEQVAAFFTEKRFAIVEIGEDDSGFELGEGARLRFTATTMAALLSNYRVVMRGANFAVLVPN